MIDGCRSQKSFVRISSGLALWPCCQLLLAESDQAAWEPVPGVAGRLKCRGQVIDTTRVATYEISLKDVDTPGLPAPVESTNATKNALSEKPQEEVELATDEDASEEDSDPLVDPTMDEAQQILLDYIKTVAKTKVVTASKEDA